MYLLEIKGDGTLALTHDYGDDDSVPKYAFISHTWGDGEVTSADMASGTAHHKEGFRKIQLFARQAVKDNLRHLWIDTCCGDLTTPEKTSDFMNSTFKWTKNAAICYVHLSDVAVQAEQNAVHAVSADDHTREDAFRQSRWFTRGWTLQELLAPQLVVFFSRDGVRLGDKQSLEGLIHEITNIPVSALRGAPLDEFSADERISWMEKRRTKREEDRAYALLGLSGVSMEVVYGEGILSTFMRLRGAIARSAKETARAREQEVGSDDEFQYSPLVGNEIRVVELRPGNQNEEISIDIRTMDLSKPLTYEALSYVWGQEPALHSVRVDDNKRIFVRPNLFHALRRMRQSSSGFLLWVDALCINQSDETERAQQVQRMAEIYRKAKGVRVWLGEEDSNSTRAMDLISGISFLRGTTHDGWWTAQRLSTFSGLLTRPWFRRGWIVQEVAFSAKTILFCGDRQVGWDDLECSIKLVAKLNDTRLRDGGQTLLASASHGLLDTFRDSPAVTLLKVVDQVFDKQEKGQLVKALHLEELVELGTSFETTDPRDSVYALLGLARETGTFTMIPNYGRAKLFVFADFVLHCCRTSASLDVICRPWVPVEHSRSQDFYMPSWLRTRDMLPFGDPRRRASYRLHGMPLVADCQNRIYRAHGNTRPEVSISTFARNGEDYPSLRAKGIIIGEIDQVSVRMGSAIVTSRCLDIVESPSMFFEKSHSSRRRTLWRIMCADRFNRTRSHAESDGAIFEQLWNRIQADPSQYNETTDDMSALDVEELLEEGSSCGTRTDFSPDITSYFELVRDTVWNRRTFRGRQTGGEGKFMAGLVAQRAKSGDTLCILYGCSVPVVLRRVGTESEEFWQLIGEAYVQDSMDGEAISSMSPEKTREAEVIFEIR